MRRALILAAIAALAAGPAAAQADAPRPEAATPTVSTRGQARVRLDNTVADVALGIEARGRSLAVVQRTLAERSTGLLTYLRGTGAERLRSELVSVEPEVEYVRNAPDRIVGYAGRLAVTFRVPAETLGEVLTTALERGANAVDGMALLPREDALAGARIELVAQATRTALAQAEAAARAAGRRPGAVLRIAVEPPALPPALLQAEAALRRAAPSAPRQAIAIAGGQSELTASVAVTVALVE